MLLPNTECLPEVETHPVGGPVPPTGCVGACSSDERAEPRLPPADVIFRKALANGGQREHAE